MPPPTSGFVTLTFTVEGEDLIHRSLSRFGQGVTSYREAFETMNARTYELEMDQFESEGSKSGGWPALAPSTLAHKPQGLPILVLTERLKESLVSAGGENVSTITDTSFSFGTVVPYGVYHQSPLPRTRLPRRPIIAFEDADKTEYVKIMQAYLVGLAQDFSSALGS